MTIKSWGKAMRCPGCGSQIPDKTKFCYFCGKETAPERRVGYSDFPPGTVLVCPKCGTKNARTEMKCTKCDADLLETKEALAKGIEAEPERHSAKCLSCGADNPISAKFCGSCGSSMAPVASPGLGIEALYAVGPVQGWIVALCYIVSFFGPPFGVVIGAVFYTSVPYQWTEHRRVGETCFILAIIGSILWTVISLLWMATL